MKNEAGQIAMVYYQPIPKVASYVSNGQTVRIAFVVRHGISLAWVDEADVSKVLASAKVTCCGGRVREAFREASSAQVKVWETGKY